ncbi:hypothetical protein [Chitinimonas koreensis]|uniref:hypothetical protein n=1 Tax=Chitinimonas koreensis TaxID=356302 RepID=UPI000491D0CB|nr:hypothetical protein [Chitinimonas koreensis]QNM97536.1 hypothetical protein H9L41_04325 [Chitinimonas koreensis]
MHLTSAYTAGADELLRRQFFSHAQAASGLDFEREDLVTTTQTVDELIAAYGEPVGRFSVAGHPGVVLRGLGTIHVLDACAERWCLS